MHTNIYEFLHCKIALMRLQWIGAFKMLLCFDLDGIGFTE